MASLTAAARTGHSHTATHRATLRPDRSVRTYSLWEHVISLVAPVVLGALTGLVLGIMALTGLLAAYLYS
jgi:hypothetical protein